MVPLVRKIFSVCLICLISLVLSADLRAQSIQYGKITGKVTLPEGEPIPGVAVTVTSPALISGKKTVLTSIDGNFIFMNLPIGRYEVTTSLEGFKSTKRGGIVIGAGSTITKNVAPDTLALSRSKQVGLTGWKRPKKQS